jgi:hypothetical protein
MCVFQKNRPLCKKKKIVHGMKYISVYNFVFEPLLDIVNMNEVKRKGKLFPVLFLNCTLRHEGVLGEWRYSSTHSLTSALDGGE